jgi:hypothetical protein
VRFLHVEIRFQFLADEHDKLPSSCSIRSVGYEAI